MQTTAQRIRDARERAGLTQAELAAAVGVAVQTISRWERGVSKPNVDDIAALAAAVGIVPAELYGESVQHVTARISGGEVSGPADLVQRVLSGLAYDHASRPVETPAEINAAKRRPNVRHTGLHRLLDHIDAGTFTQQYGLAITEDDECVLRTYGRSGPPVQSESEALRVLVSYQNERRPAPREDEVEPGVVALLADADLVERLGLTDDEIEAFRAVRWGGRIATIADAMSLRAAVLSVAGRVRHEDDTV